MIWDEAESHRVTAMVVFARIRVAVPIQIVGIESAVPHKLENVLDKMPTTTVELLEGASIDTSSTAFLFERVPDFFVDKSMSVGESNGRVNVQKFVHVAIADSHSLTMM